MYNLKHLNNLAMQGLKDMWPALKQAFNQDRSDDRLNEVYGPKPTLMVISLTIVCIAVGEWFARFSPSFPYKSYVHWPAVAVGLVFSWVIRRYLFSSKRALPDDFPWLAASLIPAFIITVISSPLIDLFFLTSQPNAETIVGTVLLMIISSLGIVAALGIAVAALCFSRDWPNALITLAVQLLVFRIMVWVTALVTLEIGIVGPILSRIIQSLTGLHIPEWLSQLSDQITYAALMGVIYLAVIGSTWTVCRNSFSELLNTGHVNILKAIESSAKNKTEA